MLRRLRQHGSSMQVVSTTVSLGIKIAFGRVKKNKFLFVQKMS